MSIRRHERPGRVRWEVRWLEHGRNRSRTFDRQGDAQQWDSELRRRKQLGPLVVAQLTTTTPTLDQWIEDRWTPEHASTLEVSTCERYASVYAKHIAEHLGDVPLGDLTVSRLRAWQAERLRSGVNPGTIHKARTFLSSVLRHAAEAEAIPGNPLSLVRAPKALQRDAARPLAPATVEAIRRALLNPPPRAIAAAGPDRRSRRRYELPAPGTPQTRQRDAVIVSLLAYAGLRPGELRALRFGDVRDNTISVERAADPAGAIKTTKNAHRRTVRLLPALAQDLREYLLATGRPDRRRLLLVTDEGAAWDKNAWQMWRADRWAPACRSAGLHSTPRPYDLRHSFASLLLAEGKQPTYVARQLGHSLTVLLSTYAHLIDEFEDADRVDAEREIAAARSISGTSHVRQRVR
jgi:integrase